MVIQKPLQISFKSSPAPLSPANPMIFYITLPNYFPACIQTSLEKLPLTCVVVAQKPFWTFSNEKRGMFQAGRVIQRKGKFGGKVFESFDVVYHDAERSTQIKMEDQEDNFKKVVIKQLKYMKQYSSSNDSLVEPFQFIKQRNDEKQ